jgi:hypothetical protein
LIKNCNYHAFTPALVRGTQNNFLNFKSGFQITGMQIQRKYFKWNLAKDYLDYIIHPQDFMKQVWMNLGF